MKIAILACACALGAVARAGPAPDTARIAVVAGWRYTPNDIFLRRSEESGHPIVSTPIGGPAVLASFAYAANERFEVAIELGASAERFALADDELWLYTLPISLVVRAWLAEVGVASFYAGGGVGSILTFASGGPDRYAESAPGTPVFLAGVALRIYPGVAIVIEDRQMFARALVPAIGLALVGGNMLAVGIHFNVAPAGGQQSTLR